TSPEPPMRVLVERSGTPKTAISIKSPTPSSVLELAGGRDDGGAAASLAVADCGGGPAVAGVWARRWKLHKATRSTKQLRERKRRFRPGIGRLLEMRVQRV